MCYTFIPWPLYHGPMGLSQVQYAEWQAPKRLACDALVAVEEFLTKLQQRLERGGKWDGVVSLVFFSTYIYIYIKI